MRRGKIDYELKRKRIRLARQCISEGLNLTDFAKMAGVSKVAATVYLRQHSPACHAALKNGFRRNHLPPLRVLHRLRVVSQSRTLTAAAKELGISHPALTTFLARNAPDGVELALADYEDAYGAPLLEGEAA